MRLLQAIELMNNFGAKRESFFVVFDFIMENILFFDQNDLENKKILVEFPNFSNISTKKTPSDFVFSYSKYDYETYKKSFYNVLKNIEFGNTFLCNLTASIDIETNLDLESIFYISKAKYKLFIKDKFVCFSPEIFVKIENNKIYSFPMKGTIDANIPNAEKILLESKKETAEHYTIVDLIRNDLSMISQNVRVEKFKYLDLIRTNKKNLYQMSSVISGDLDKDWHCKIGTIISTLLPAGSVTGAPKKKTVEIILESETHQRGYYTGVAGYFDGQTFDSCVLIRFIEQQDNKKIYKTGGGITFMSNIDDEYNELHNKVYIPI